MSEPIDPRLYGYLLAQYSGPPDAGMEGNWQAQPAPDGRYVGRYRPPVGNGKNHFYGITEEQGKTPDAFPYFMTTPGLPWGETERAYNPTLQEEFAMNDPANRDLQRLWQRKGWYPAQQEAAREFQRPKTLEEIFSSDRYTNEALRQMAPWMGMP